MKIKIKRVYILALIAILLIILYTSFELLAYLELRSHAFFPRYMGKKVYVNNIHPKISLVARQLSDFQMSVPNNFRIQHIAMRQNEPMWLSDPKKNISIFIMAKSGLESWTPDNLQTYEFQKQILHARWNPRLLAAQMLIHPRGSKKWNFFEVEALHWKGFCLASAEKSSRRNFTVYALENKKRIVEIDWVIKSDIKVDNLVKKSMASLQFLPNSKHFSMQDVVNLSENNPAETQFILAQKYIHNPSDHDILKKLTIISANLNSWHMVESLSHKYLQKFPNDREIQKLQEIAKKN